LPDAYSVEITKSAIKELAALDSRMRARIRKAVEDLKEGSVLKNPKRVLKLSGEPDRYRMRVGKYRIIFRLSGRQIIIERIASRGKAYG